MSQKFIDAISSYDEAISLKPDLVEAHYNRGNSLKEINRIHEAIQSYDKAISINPEFLGAYINRGISFQNVKDFNRALKDFDKAISLKADCAEAHGNRGSALKELKRLEDAVESYDKAILLNPTYVEAFRNRGLALLAMRDVVGALQNFDEAINLKPSDAESYWNKSLALILSGQYLDGWKMYEWRLKKEDMEGHYYKSLKDHWRGDFDLTEKKIFVQAEQGLGDFIQFCRFVPLLQTLGCEVILEVPKRLTSLISTLDPSLRIIEQGSTIPDFDVICPLMSLPYAFRTQLETIPSRIPYLFSDKFKEEEWKRKLGEKRNLRIGIAWSGSVTYKNDTDRSIRLSWFSSILDLPIEFHSLQIEYRSDDIQFLDEHPEIRRHDKDQSDFSDTAALIECMDIVISVDTSVAHLAGALGKTVWILLPFVPHYMWMLNRNDSPWYRTARLFRQPRINDWGSVISHLENELRSLINERTSVDSNLLSFSSKFEDAYP